MPNKPGRWPAKSTRSKGRPEAWDWICLVLPRTAWKIYSPANVRGKTATINLSTDCSRKTTCSRRSPRPISTTMRDSWTTCAVRGVSGDAAPRADAKLEAHLDRVLIVEPSVATLQFCVKVLQELGSPQVTSVRDGYEALGLLLKEKFDAVITSLQIPTIDGQSLTAVLRTIPGPNAATPVVLLTSAAGALDPAKARPDYVVEKNLGLVNELSAVLQRLARRASGASSELKARALRKI